MALRVVVFFLDTSSDCRGTLASIRQALQIEDRQNIFWLLFATAASVRSDGIVVLLCKLGDCNGAVPSRGLRADLLFRPPSPVPRDKATITASRR